MLLVHRSWPVASQPWGSMVGVLWLRHITVMEGFGCSTQQLGSSFYQNALQFKPDSHCEISPLDRWLYRFDSAFWYICLFLGLSCSVCALVCVCTLLPLFQLTCGHTSVYVESELIFMCLSARMSISFPPLISVFICLQLLKCDCCKKKRKERGMNTWKYSLVSGDYHFITCYGGNWSQSCSETESLVPFCHKKKLNIVSNCKAQDWR